MDVRHNNNALKELNDCIGGLLHLGLNVITFRSLLHLGPNVITFRTLLHLGQLLHLGLQQALPHNLLDADKTCFSSPKITSKFVLAKFQVCYTYHHPRWTPLHQRAGYTPRIRKRPL